MKAIIPVAGMGSKLRPHTHTQPKPLIPVAGKPILGHIIDSLIEVGITQQVFILGYLRGKIKEYVVTHYSDKIEMEFVVQEPRRGLGHAIWTARETFAGEKEILISLGDTIFGDEVQKIIGLPGSQLGLQTVDNPEDFGIADVNAEGVVTNLEEKPQIPLSNWALVGLYKLDNIPVLIQELEKSISKEIPLSEEYKFTDVLMQMLQRGVNFQAMKVENWFDCGKRESLLQTNRTLLDAAQLKSPPPGDYPNTVFIPPVFIPKNCSVSNSIIGPYVALAEHAVIKNSIVKNSILGTWSRLERIILHNSIIGNDTSLIGKATSVNIGDNTEIDFDE